jgi:nicotinamidase/pyrazinamidase
MNALLLVDIQNDFLPGGALAVPGGDEIVAIANRLMPHYDLVVASKDWHPADHKSFASQHLGKQPGNVVDLDGLQQHLWPIHCVQRTHGADFADDLNREGIHHVILKGTDPHVDSYSAFFDNARRKETGLAKFLRKHGVTELHVMGLATDYCVKATVLDAVELGFRTILLTDAVRGVEVRPGDCQRAIDEMHAAGVTIRRSRSLKENLEPQTNSCLA